MSTAAASTASFIANRKALLSAYNAASSVSPVRSPKPILQSVKLVVGSDGTAQILGTDLEVGIRMDVQGVQSDTSDASVEIVLPRKFGEILSKCQDADITIKVGDDQQILVAGLRSKFSLSTEQPELFPDVPEAPATGGYFSVLAGDLRTLISRTQYATDPESTRYALGGAMIELVDGFESIAFVATDGIRLARQQVSMTIEREIGHDGPSTTFTTPPVVPLKALKLIARVISDADDDMPVHVFIDNKRIIVRTSTATIYSRLVEGRFPKYQDVFPRSPDTKATVTAGELKVACQQASITTDGASRGVDFAFGTDWLTLSSQSADAGASTIEATVKLDGPPVDLSLDPRYLLDALATVEGGQEVVIEMIDAKNALVMRVEGGFSYVVMPLTREK